MIYYRCYDAHSDGRKYASTDQRWRVAISSAKYRVSLLDETCSGLLMHSNGDTHLFFVTIFGSLKAVKKTDLPKSCQESLDKYMEGYETEEVL